MSLMTVKSLRSDAQLLSSQNKHPAALQKLKQAVTVVVGDGFEVPLYANEGGGVRSKKYMDMDPRAAFFLMGCCEDISACLQKMGNVEQSLNWLNEIDVIHKNMFIARTDPMFDWKNYTFGHQMFFDSLIIGTARAADIYPLGNTGLGAFNSTRVGVFSNLLTDIGADLKNDHLQDIVRSKMNGRIFQLRHPDPSLSHKHELQHPALQVRGSWRKVAIPKSKNIQPRQMFASFVWNGRFYVCGGESAVLGPWFRDLRYIELEDMQQGWHELPGYPVPVRKSAVRMAGWQMHVDDATSKAYLFIGRRDLDVFDLEANTWSQVTTKMAPGQGAWPVSDSISDYGILVLKSRLYVFGGSHNACYLGSNLFVVLDLKTLQWRRLSGRAGPDLVVNTMEPGPRTHPAMWVDGTQERIWVMFGDADRQAAGGHGQEHGEEDSYPYADFWSWDIEGETWRRERIAGNPPCPRTEMSYVYNRTLGKAIMFGGFNSTLPTMFAEQRLQFKFTYFADTFLYDPGTHRWKQVITKGFPTYRAQAELFVDPKSGKTFLFGGYTNSQFVKDKKHAISRSFADIWQLHLDVPGGFFEEVDLEEEVRTAKAGPWQRCFACGSAGIWKKCGGSCRGRVFFCDSDCQREGWKEHKEKHGCSRL
ncbi:hypothetical protein OF83DRAFT_1163971 [Amylostereum chailletii]|nr:hypothetical protein OF83DRAFT_1163971 [Amylostereum chailletii]